jgi:hypothetical protein
MWYYSTEGKQHGPIDDGALDNLIATGVVGAATPIWKEGMQNWMPLCQVRPAGITTGDAAAATCSLCGKRVGAENLIELMGNRVCAECKPLALQSMREGAALPAKNHTAWREGKRVVARNQTSLPARCFKCNCEVTTPPLTRKLYWHPAGYYLVIFFNILIYAIVAAIVRKRATLDIYLCPDHLQRRKKFMIGGWLGALLGLVVGIAGIAMNTPWMIILGFVILPAAIIVGIAGAQIARPARIKADTVWLTGSGKAFLESLPTLP